MGPTPLLHGSERRALNRLIKFFYLIDNRLIAILKSGPHFTRQATYGDRLDQSCLDRSYNSDRVAWMEFVWEMVHDATQTLSDHHPSLIRFALKPLAPSRMRKSLYFKLDANELLVESTCEALQWVWREHMVEDRDPVSIGSWADGLFVKRLKA